MSRTAPEVTTLVVSLVRYGVDWGPGETPGSPVAGFRRRSKRCIIALAGYDGCVLALSTAFSLVLLMFWPGEPWVSPPAW
ncbi:hypothetical protein ACIBAG_38210 [Streptomyces sp. NPDC051243]|uniref:hypothetical protein n=1 Tax=Streptomyces sp. NPDC051243 TaxID=3365646 RepID=UPI0037A9F029